jgi:hypothetical protein
VCEADGSDKIYENTLSKIDRCVRTRAKYQCPKVGMDSDVWESELSVFVSAKNVNMDIRIRIVFNMDVR